MYIRRKAGAGAQNEEHFSTIFNLHGKINDALGEYKSAIEHHTKALEITKKCYGEECSYVADSLNNIGHCYYAQGNYAEALLYYTEALKIRRKVLGVRHPDVARA